jgi:predicted RNA-binding protein with PUA-like domain
MHSRQPTMPKPAKSSQPLLSSGASARRFWLLKSEPETFSFDDLLAAPRKRTGWSGVRNHQAKLYLRDQMQVGDGILFYHSSAKPPGVAGVARVARAGYPDPTQFDRRSEHHDPKSRASEPTWYQVDVAAVAAMKRFVPLEALRVRAELRGMLLLQRGQRLSVMPVAPGEWKTILALGGLDPERS